jgi:hypothetical protein
MVENHKCFAGRKENLINWSSQLITPTTPLFGFNLSNGHFLRKKVKSKDYTVKSSTALYLVPSFNPEVNQCNNNFYGGH